MFFLLPTTKRCFLICHYSTLENPYVMVLGACCITKQKENRDCVNTFWFNLKAKLHVVCMNELEMNYYQLTSSTFNELATNSLIPLSQKKSKNPNALKRKIIASLIFKLFFFLDWVFPNFILHLIPHSMIISRHLIKKCTM